MVVQRMPRLPPWNAGPRNCSMDLPRRRAPAAKLGVRWRTKAAYIDMTEIHGRRDNTTAGPESAHAVGRTPATPHSGVQVTGEGTGLLVLFQLAWNPTVV